MPKVRNAFKEINKKSDSYGNALIVEQEPRFGLCRVYVSLANEGGRKRFVGEIDRSLKILTVRRDKTKHLHQMSKSYGFNRTVIFTMGWFDHILLEEADLDGTINYYLFSDNVVMTHGRRLHFLTNGFELQVFLSLDIIRKFEVPAGKWKENRISQLNNQHANTASDIKG